MGRNIFDVGQMFWALLSGVNDQNKCFCLEKRRAVKRLSGSYDMHCLWVRPFPYKVLYPRPAMDEHHLHYLLECSVCLEQLDQSCKVLPCQHTFCRRCLKEIVEWRKELRCPECRVLVTEHVDDLPANILLVRILEQLNRQKGTINLDAESNEKRSNQVRTSLTLNGFTFAIFFAIALEP